MKMFLPVLLLTVLHLPLPVLPHRDRERHPATAIKAAREMLLSAVFPGMFRVNPVYLSVS